MNNRTAAAIYESTVANVGKVAVDATPKNPRTLPLQGKIHRVTCDRLAGLATEAQIKIVEDTARGLRTIGEWVALPFPIDLSDNPLHYFTEEAGQLRVEILTDDAQDGTTLRTQLVVAAN